MPSRNDLSLLPSVDRLLGSDEAVVLTEEFGRHLVTEAIRTNLDQCRSELLAGEGEVPGDAALMKRVRLWLERIVAPSLIPVINATGVIIHTNLGRSPLCDSAITAIKSVAVGYSNLEYDLDLEQRGSRSDHAESLLTRLTGTEAALVVNNNAAAVLLMLTALCQGAEVIISRGQLVEIGGGFRIPDVMAQSGARLIEVGTTNRTHLHDYADAIGENTAAILVAHHSNYKIIGFTSEPSLADLAHLARDNDLLLLYDQGSGALLDTSVYGLEREPCVNDGVRDGVDVIAFSGDKLVGGPQAGILCGSQELIQRIKGHPLARAVRADKLCLAALTDTLRHYLVGDAAERIPVWAMIARTVESLEEVASSWADSLQAAGLKANVIDGESTIGGGSLPGTTLPTRLLAIEHPQVHYLASRLHHADPPIIGRITRNRLLLDPRTVAPEQVDKIVNSVIVCVQNIVSEKD